MPTLAPARSGRTGLDLRYNIGKLFKYRHLPQYLWYHKLLFGIKNTKFDITFCVFRESFLRDQYNIRKFLSELKGADTLTFIDLGRNHGLVFYYTMHYIMKHKVSIKTIKYYGVDPSPLKFVYFNFHHFLRANAISIQYNIIDRAVVFDNATKVTLSYGEKNFGNFHVAGSNYADRAAGKQSRHEYVDITVDTIRFSEIAAIIEEHGNSDAMIVKIDCKNRTDHMFFETLDRLQKHRRNFLVAAEHDRSSDRDIAPYVSPDKSVLTASQVTSVGAA